MAAESPRRILKAPGAVVRPQPISDKTVMDSVVHFLHDVVPQSYSGSAKVDEKEPITWVKFAHADINDIVYAEHLRQNVDNSPLLLILGYSNGVQIWTIPTSGEAQEVLSWRQGAVRSLCVLPTPDTSNGNQDVFASRRPLIAMSDSSSAGQQFCSVTFVSLRNGDQVHCIKFKNPVCNIQCNKRILVVPFQEKIAIFDACTFREKFTISSCYPSSGLNMSPISLGTQWLAYADQKLVTVHQTCGGVAGYGLQSYTATVIHAAKTLTKGLSIFGETVANSLTGSKSSGGGHFHGKDHSTDASQPQPGIVTIVDIKTVGEGEVMLKKFRARSEDDNVNIHEDSSGEGIVAHFVAHANDPVAALQFDCSGQLLLTADRRGHNFHVFRVLPHPVSSSMGAVHHLYTLYRGDTTAKVQDIVFSVDSRWVAVSTLRGTTHIFPITPYGGPVTVRTHTSQRVVNRLSRFHKSAGLEDIQPKNTGRNSPVLVGSPGGSGGVAPPPTLSGSGQVYTAAGRMGNPRLPPYPHPTVVSPLAQIRQSTPLAGFTAAAAAGPRSPPTKGSRSGAGAVASETVNVAAAFAAPRSWLVASPSLNKDKNDKRPVDCLFIVGCNGEVIEYLMEPRPPAGSSKGQEDISVELDVLPRAQWFLNRTTNILEVKPPLPSTNPLMVAQDGVASLKNDRQYGMSHLSTSGMGRSSYSSNSESENEEPDDRWLSQVEIITHAGPHRRLWMGPQFSFKTFQHAANTTILSATSSALLCQSSESFSPQGSMDIFMDDFNAESIRPTRSTPMAMPGGRHTIPLLIEAGSGSFEQSPGMFEACGSWPDSSLGSCPGVDRPSEEQVRERLADAMMDCHTSARGPVDLGHMRRNVSAEFQGSSEELSTSSSQSGSASQMSDARTSPPHALEHLLVFPGTPPASPGGRNSYRN